MIFKKTIVLASLFLLTTGQALAQAPTSFAALVNVILGLINIAIPLIFGALFVFLVWKIFNSWVLNAADEGAREEGRQYAVVAVIVFVVMVVAWGIVAMLRTSLFGI